MFSKLIQVGGFQEMMNQSSQKKEKKQVVRLEERSMGT